MAVKPNVSTPSPLPKGGKNIQIDTNLVEAVSGVLYYELMAYWYSVASPQAMRQYNNKIFKAVDINYGKYLDQKARVLPKSYHHVYEWNMLGKKEGRLWKLRKRNSSDSSMEIRYDFLTSKKVAPINPKLATPGPTGKRVTRSSIFKNKAYVMEEGIPVHIKLKQAQFLAIPNIYGFNGRGDIIFSKGPITVQQPGGPGVKYSFAKTFSGYFSSGLAVKELNAGKVLQTPARLTQKVGEDVPSAIYKASVRRGVDKNFIEDIARRNAEKYGREEY